MTRKTTDPGRDTTLGELLEILSHPSRRRILSTLADDNPRDEEEFHAERFASDDEDLEQFLLELSHVHLPQLAEAEFIEWDSETDTIRRGSRFEEIEPLLILIRDHQEELPEGWP